MIGKKIINKIIEEGLVSAVSECVSVWSEDADSVLTDFVNDHISQEGKKVTCQCCAYYFQNCFDESFCEKGMTGTRVCKQFKIMEANQCS